MAKMRKIENGKEIEERKKMDLQGRQRKWRGNKNFEMITIGTFSSSKAVDPLLVTGGLIGGMRLSDRVEVNAEVPTYSTFYCASDNK